MRNSRQSSHVKGKKENQMFKCVQFIFRYPHSTFRISMVSGQGFEPRSTGSEPVILPVRRTRNIGREGGTRTRYIQLEKLIARRFAFIPVKWRIGKNSNLYSSHERQFCRLPAFADRCPMHEKNLVKTEGFEPSTFSFVARCSDSVELRLQWFGGNGRTSTCKGSLPVV